MDIPITVKLGEMMVSGNENVHPRASELAEGLEKFKNKLPIHGELGQPEIGEDEDPKAFYKRFGKINSERVAFEIKEVEMEQTNEGKVVVFTAKIVPEGPMSGTLKEMLEQPPMFAMRAFRSRLVGGGKAKNGYDIITWDVINPH